MDTLHLLPRRSANSFAPRSLAWLVLLLMSLPWLAQAQCPTRNVTLSTQAQVDAFPPACTNFNYLLIISGGDITNLNGLRNLQSASSDLQIVNNPALTSITALTSLTNVGFRLLISNNPSLASLDGLNKLQNVGKDFQIVNDSTLTSIAALTALTSVGGSLLINNNPKLISLDGLNKLQNVGSDFQIVNDPTLTSITALTTLTSVGGSLRINNNPNLASLDGLNKLQRVGSDFQIVNNSALSVCALPAICQLIATKSPNQLRISGNAPGCNSVQAVQDNCSPLAITSQPPSASTVCVGTAVTASVSTTGNVGTYQWYQNNKALTSQTSATLTLPNTTTANTGSYVVVVSNSVSSLTSTAFSLSITPQSPDYQALVDLYNATGGPNWTKKTNWLTGCTPCDWEGVICTNGRVTGLNLGGNNLVGSIPASLSALTNLQALILLSNQLSGSIPASLSALTNLQSLNLYNNQLSGNIPASLSALTNLLSLRLDNNQLSGCFPASLSALCGKDVQVSNNPGLPGGGDFAAFCASGAGSDAFRPLTTASTNPVCAGSPVSLSVTIGTFYQWSGPASFTATTQTPTFTPATAASSGLYSVTVGNGSPTCTATASVSLTVNPLPTVSISPSATAICTGQSATFAATPGLAAYRWTTPNGGPTLTTASISVSVAGTYSLTVTSASGCTATAQASLTVNPLPNASFTGLPASVCVDAPPLSLTPTTPGGVFSGPGISGNQFSPASAETGGPYSITYTVSSMGCLNSTNQPVTVNPLPQAPMIATQSGHSYPGGVSSLTISQNTGNVVLMTSGCMGGTITWAGGTSSTLAVSTTNTGVQTFTAICTSTSTGCTSPKATATVTVVGGTLSVLHRDGNGQLNTNTLAPYLELQNDGKTPIPYSEITVRYFLTVENYAPLLFSINYAQLGSDKVHLKYVPATTGNPTATGYIEFSFDAAAGSLGAGQNSGPIQDLINKQDYSNFDQRNDYSYVNTGQYTPNPRITAYRNGVIFYGMEPGPVTPMQSVKAMLQNNTGDGANSIEAVLSVTNDGNVPINYSDLKVRYYFTADNSQPLVLGQTGYTALGSGNVSAQIVTISPPLTNADRYLELSFSPSLGQLAPGASTGGVTYQIRHADYSGFSQTNDYSYQGTGGTMVNPHVVVFVAGQRVYGTEPGAAARLAAEEAGKLAVQVLGNPVTGSTLSVSVSGAEGQALLYELTDVSGHVVGERQVESAGAVDEQSLAVGHQPAGLLLLRVSTPTRSQTVKVLRQ